MKSETGKVIGFRQKVPYLILENNLYIVLRDGDIDNVSVKRDLQEYFSGQNRISKAATTVNSVLKNNIQVIDKLRKKISPEDFLKLSQTDKSAVVLSLLCLAYPFVYEALVSAASTFKIQESISRDLLQQKMTAAYGSNRGVYIGVGEMLSTFVEMNLFERKKTSVYTKTSQKPISNPYISELNIYTDIRLSGSKSILTEDVKYRPWFSYFMSDYHLRNVNYFIQYSDGIIGNGYLSLKN